MSLDMGGSLLELSKLLGGAGIDGDDDSELDSGPVGTMHNPGQIGPPKTAGVEPTTAQKKLQKAKAKAQNASDTKDIWDAEDVAVEDHGAEDDPRPEPEYTTMYKQEVSNEDMFLQMSGRDPSSHWCEDMVVKIQLPGHKMSDCELEVTDNFLDLRTSTHRLGLPLPHPCDSKNGSAKFDSDKCILTVTLRMMREMDFLRSGAMM